MYKDLRTTDVIAVIPSKSNMDGLITIVKQLILEKSVKEIRIVADGNTAFANINQLLVDNDIPDYCDTLCVMENSGIHKMWNYGAENIKDHHILYINDDVTIDSGAIDALAGMLDIHGELGVICPNYDNRPISDPYQSVSIACPGRYDGTDGLAGFCFMVSKEQSKDWKFDERMKWYYGDNDIVNWVRLNGKVAAVSGVATMQLNPSWTKTNDPPPGFHDATKNDAQIFERKWNSDGTLAVEGKDSES